MINISEKTSSNELKKWVHTFDEDGGTSPFAAIHNLGTKEVHVSTRQKNGEAREVKSVVQDSNVVIVHSANNYGFGDGDTIIIMG